MEDIIKVLKYEIKISLIFTEYGTWKLTANNSFPHLKDATNEHTELLVKNLKKIQW